MDQEETVFLIMITNLCGLMLSMLSLAGGLEYFATSLGFIVIINFLIIGGYILTNGSSSKEEASVNPVNALQRKFANGELTEEEFERKLDRIVETQDIAEQIDDESLNVLEET